MAPAIDTQLSDRIHDGPLQLLASAMVQAELCEQLAELGRTEGLAQRLADMRDTMDRACADLREVMRDLRQVSLEDTGDPAHEEASSGGDIFTTAP